MIDKTYDAGAIESRIYARWGSSGAFQCGRPGRENAEPFTIVIPPPNVTGSLHMGHALNDTLQDILVRFERMRGKDVLWQPGMDHAGIATQMVVERQMAERQEPGRRDIGREAFVEKVWSWKSESGGIIINQLKRLGCSCDWSRERFTMDEGLSRAVLKTFVTLYRDGLIYKDKRLVNWDPKLLTAISDLEVQNVDQTAQIWYFRYPIKGYDGRFVTVATTRPETMLGDTAVAVHPDDERYAELVGKMVVLPLVGREIPIIDDEYSDPEKGSGAVKITPAHDFNDFEVGRRNDLPMINIFDAHAALNDEVPETYRGLDRFEARKRVVADLDALGLLEKTEEVANTVPFGDRSNVIIEPWLTDQWYVDAATLAKPAIEAVETGKTVFVPKNWEKTYFEWMRNIQPWCISRQLWWGHQIPAWYGADGEVFVAESEVEAKAAARAHYGDDRAIERDSDVLDTWFSSALWPFSTLGWPDETPELARHYQTDVLVTGFDIIFFWVARMMMAGLHLMTDEKGEPEVPFHTVYIHALVRDEKGQKMSKSKGNVMDPLDLIDDYGADALRFTLAAMAAQGRDIKMARNRVEGYRNFATKLWNATRFCEMNGCVRMDGFDPSGVMDSTNRWIVGEAEKTVRAVTDALEDYRFNEAAAAIYRFTWNTFCDWFLELSKPILNGTDEAAANENRATAAWTLDQILKLLHPFMPFVTEELWEKTGAAGSARDSHLIEAEWPTFDGLIDADADAEINWLIEAVTAIRSVRSEMNVSPSAELPLILVDPDLAISKRVERLQPVFMRLARLSVIKNADAVPEGAIQALLGQTVAALPIADVIDIAAEQARLEKDRKKLDGDITGIDKKLANEQFLSKAPDHVIEEQKTRRADALAKRETVDEALDRLRSLA